MPVVLNVTIPDAALPRVVPALNGMFDDAFEGETTRQKAIRVTKHFFKDDVVLKWEARQAKGQVTPDDSLVEVT